MAAGDVKLARNAGGVDQKRSAGDERCPVATA